MIVAALSTMKKYLPAIVITGEQTLFDDLLVMAQDELDAQILGDVITASLEPVAAPDPPVDPLVPPEEVVLTEAEELALADTVKLRTMCERIISLSAFLKSIPDVDLVLTPAGFAVHSSDKMAPASRQRVDALTRSITERLDSSIDALINFLLLSATYEDWRGTVQFENISSGLICTFKEFRQYALYSLAVAERYPKSYTDFAKLYPNMCSALMMNVSTYLSTEYCLELIEKFKDNEISAIPEKQVLSYIKYAIAAFVLGDDLTGRKFVMKAFQYMKSNIASFPTFAHSTAAESLENTHTDTPIFSII